MYVIKVCNVLFVFEYKIIKLTTVPMQIHGNFWLKSGLASRSNGSEAGKSKTSRCHKNDICKYYTL